MKSLLHWGFTALSQCWEGDLTLMCAPTPGPRLIKTMVVAMSHRNIPEAALAGGLRGGWGSGGSVRGSERKHLGKINVAPLARSHFNLGSKKTSVTGCASVVLNVS